MAIELSSLKKTPTGMQPPLITVYGTDGVGKTGFALSAPDCVYLPTEPRFGHYEAVNLFQTKENPNAICEDFDQMLEGLNELGKQSHNFKTLVIDTLDHLEPMIWDAVIKKYPTTERGKPVNSIEDHGFGKGYVYAMDAWTHFYKVINKLRNLRGMAVILVAHYQLKDEASAESENYDQYQIKLHKKAASLTREVSDAVLFAKFKTHISKVGEGLKERNIPVGTGERVLICQPKPSCVVKNSFNTLPDEIPLDWDTFAKHIPFFNKPKSNNQPKPQE